MTEDGTSAVLPDEVNAARVRRARYGKLPARVRPEDWVEENETDLPVELAQSIGIVQHPGRVYGK